MIGPDEVAEAQRYLELVHLLAAILDVELVSVEAFVLYMRREDKSPRGTWYSGQGWVIEDRETVKACYADFLLTKPEPVVLPMWEGWPDPTYYQAK